MTADQRRAGLTDLTRLDEEMRAPAEGDESISRQYLREQVARQMESVHEALGKPQGQPKGMTPTQVRDGIADWIETNINHREFWTPEVVELIRSIEINERASVQAPAPVGWAGSLRHVRDALTGSLLRASPEREPRLRAAIDEVDALLDTQAPAVQHGK